MRPHSVLDLKIGKIRLDHTEHGAAHLLGGMAQRAEAVAARTFELSELLVDVLGVRHVIVTGHYGCGGVRAVWERQKVGLSDNWLRHVEDVRQQHEVSLNALPPDAAVDRLCELNEGGRAAQG